MGQIGMPTSGEWVHMPWGYEDDHEETAALVAATSRHKRRLTPDEIAAEIELRGRRYLRTVFWFGSTKAHREADFCECEPGGFCENGGGESWVEAVLCAPADGEDRGAA